MQRCVPLSVERVRLRVYHLDRTSIEAKQSIMRKNPPSLVDVSRDKYLVLEGEGNMESWASRAKCRLRLLHYMAYVKSDVLASSKRWSVIYRRREDVARMVRAG